MSEREADEIAKRRRQRMIRIDITAAAPYAIRSTLPEDVGALNGEPKRPRPGRARI